MKVRPCLCCKSECPGWEAITETRRVEGSIICERPPIGSITIDVLDTGAGMTESQIGMIFQEGIQFDAARLQAGGGSGLGLAIAKGIIERHNGVIRAESEGPDRGSKFTVILPLYGTCNRVTDFGGRLTTCSGTAKVMALPESGHTGSQSGSTLSADGPQSGSCTPATSRDMMCCQDIPSPNCAPAPSCTAVVVPVVAESAKAETDRPNRDISSQHPIKHKILIAEDVLACRKMLIRLLERAGHSCVIACNGQEAVDAIQTSIDGDLEEGNCIDTILMDFEMPVMNGPDATQKIRELGYQGRILGLTGNLLREDVEYFIMKGADGVFPKPFNISLLTEAWGDST